MPIIERGRIDWTFKIQASQRTALSMNLHSLLEGERTRYVDHLVRAHAHAAAQSAACVAELLLSINSEAIPYPYRYLRVDQMQAGADGKPQPCEVRVGLAPAFEPRQFKFGDLVLEVHPFTWNSVRILFDQPIRDSAGLDTWITTRLDIDGRNPDAQSGLSRAIHSFTQVARVGTWWQLTGDFGTAPIEALVEFIELLAGQGSRRILITGGDATT